MVYKWLSVYVRIRFVISLVTLNDCQDSLIHVMIMIVATCLVSQFQMAEEDWCPYVYVPCTYCHEENPGRVRHYCDVTVDEKTISS